MIVRLRHVLLSIALVLVVAGGTSPATAQSTPTPATGVPVPRALSERGCLNLMTTARAAGLLRFFHLPMKPPMPIGTP